MGKKFTNRELAFIYHRARGIDPADCIMKAGYKARSRNQASKYAWDLLQKQEIIEAIEVEKTRIFDKAKITDEYVLQGLNEIALNGEIEANRTRAFELLGKYLAMFTEKRIIEQHYIEPTERERKLTRLRTLIIRPISKETEKPIQPVVVENKDNEP